MVGKIVTSYFHLINNQQTFWQLAVPEDERSWFHQEQLHISSELNKPCTLWRLLLFSALGLTTGKKDFIIINNRKYHLVCVSISKQTLSDHALLKVEMIVRWLKNVFPIWIKNQRKVIIHCYPPLQSYLLVVCVKQNFSYNRHQLSTSDVGCFLV